MEVQSINISISQPQERSIGNQSAPPNPKQEMEPNNNNQNSNENLANILPSKAKEKEKSLTKGNKKNCLSRMNELPCFVKFLLTFFFIDIYPNLIRLLRSIEKRNGFGICLSLFLLCCGCFPVWVIDIFCVCSNRPIMWID